jgi:hypothetical protein
MPCAWCLPCPTCAAGRILPAPGRAGQRGGSDHPDRYVAAGGRERPVKRIPQQRAATPAGEAKTLLMFWSEPDGSLPRLLRAFPDGYITNFFSVDPARTAWRSRKIAVRQLVSDGRRIKAPQRNAGAISMTTHSVGSAVSSGWVAGGKEADDTSRQLRRPTAVDVLRRPCASYQANPVPHLSAHQKR